MKPVFSSMTVTPPETPASESGLTDDASRGFGIRRNAFFPPTMMHDDALLRIRRELLEGDGEDGERLARAIAAFRSALGDYRRWPKSIQVRADLLRAILISESNFETAVGRLDDATVREVSNELWRFCEAARQARETQPAVTRGCRVDGLETLREARGLLSAGTPDGDRERVRIAARRFWSAMFYGSSWPPPLRAMAEALTTKIFRHGPIDDAIVRMDDQTVFEVALDLRRICDEAETFAGSSANRDE